VQQRLDAWSGRLPAGLRPALERHAQNLVALAQSLEAAGQSPDVIRGCLRDLLASYEAELVDVLAPTRLT
jgi:predicted component of type VI protein secretion system